MEELRQDELMFFAGHEEALPIYLHLREALSALGTEIEVEVKKSQISLKNKRLFGAVSFAPVRPKARRPRSYITVTFGLGHRLDSLRVDAAVEPYPGRWTHHVMLGDSSEIDNELMDWISEALEFASTKR